MTLSSDRALACGAALIAGALAFSSTTRAQQLIPNTQRYAERNPSAAQGRSGSALISVRALASRYSGMVTLEAATGSFEQGWPYTSGAFTGLQLQALAADGTVERTYNATGLEVGPFTVIEGVPLAYGQGYRVQARVRAVDGRRTDVVTASAVVRRRPDLDIVLLDPGPVPVDAASNLTALVSNLDTDVGVRANCMLFVGDSPYAYDFAENIWIDGGDSATCVFTHFFREVGSQPVRVAVESVEPADDNPDNNEATAVIEVAPNPTPVVSWRVNKSRLVYHDGFERSAGFTTIEFPTQGSENVWGQEWDYEYALERSAYESAGIALESATHMAFPLASFDVSFTSGGQTLVAIHEVDVAADSEYSDGLSGYAYLQRYDEATQTTVWCQSYFSNTEAITYLSASRFASRVTYWATGYRRTWYSWLPGQDTYEYYTPHDDLVAVLSPEFAEHIELSAVDATGRVFAGGGTVEPTTTEGTGGQPHTCFDLAYQTRLGFYTSQFCSEYSTPYSSSQGEVSGTTGSF